MGRPAFRENRSTLHRLMAFLLLSCLGLASLNLPAAEASPENHHAAVIVDLGDGRVVVRVVSFPEETISGAELLLRSGLHVAFLPGWGPGTAVCAIEGVGCPPTPQDCFCRCHGAECLYWSYFHLQAGRWVYAPVGAGDHRLSDGDVDGWVWGDGKSVPPLLTWEEIWAQSVAAPPTGTSPPASASPAGPPERVTPTPSRVPSLASIAGSPSMQPSASPVPAYGASPTVEAPALGETPAATVSPSPFGRGTPTSLPTKDAPAASTPTDAVQPASAAERSWPIPPGAIAFVGMALLLGVAWVWVRWRR